MTQPPAWCTAGSPGAACSLGRVTSTSKDPRPCHTGTTPLPGWLCRAQGWYPLVSLEEMSWNSQPAVLKKLQNSGKCLQGLLLPSSHAGTGSQTPNKALHEDSAQQLEREVISFPTQTEMFRNLLSLDQHCQNRLILPKQEHLLLLEFLLLHQLWHCSAVP